MYNWLYESTKIENAKEEARAEVQAAAAKALAAVQAEAQAAKAAAQAEEKARFAKFTEDLTAKLHAAGLPLETIANVIASSMKAVQAQA